MSLARIILANYDNVLFYDKIVLIDQPAQGDSTAKFYVNISHMDHMSKYQYNEHEIEKAITYLVINFKKSGHNPKPVVLHSMRVADLLWNIGIPQQYIISAILHDILEDTKVINSDLSIEFGDDIANIVESLTFHKKEDFKQSFLASKKDPNVAAIRAADLIDNSNYYNLEESLENNGDLFVFEKFQFFMDNVSGVLPKQVLDLLNIAYENNVAGWNTKK